MDYVYENICDYNPSRKRKVLIKFHHMIANITTNEKFQAIIKKLFLYSLVFIIQSYYSVPKKCRIKFNTLFDHENQQQKRITKYCD